MKTKLHNLKSKGLVTHEEFDKAIFNQIKQMLGGNVKLIMVGSSPISVNVMDFLKIAFCCNIREGYGMSETCSVISACYADDTVSGHVGGPLANIKLRLRSIPEMNYLVTSNPPRGEICVHSPCVMDGYFNNKAKTDEDLKDGWLHTGDVG